MDPFFEEYKDDLNRLRKLIMLIDEIKAFGSVDTTGIQSTPGDFIDQSCKVVTQSRECQSSLIILTGTILLYLGGRFENFVKAEFEYLCRRIAKRCNYYKDLPKDMKNNIITFTAIVTENPRRYGHAEQGVRSFIKNLSRIFDEDTELEEEVNSACLSITDTNMRPDVIDELFQRIGARNIWERIGSKAKIIVFFEAPQTGEAKNKCIKYLNNFIDLRNKIAHPATVIEWPDTAQVTRLIDYFEILGEAISEETNVYELSLSARNNQ